MGKVDGFFWGGGNKFINAKVNLDYGIYRFRRDSSIECKVALYKIILHGDE